MQPVAPPTKPHVASYLLSRLARYLLAMVLIFFCRHGEPPALRRGVHARLHATSRQLHQSFFGGLHVRCQQLQQCFRWGCRGCFMRRVCGLEVDDAPLGQEGPDGVEAADVSRQVLARVREGEVPGVGAARLACRPGVKR